MCPPEGDAGTGMVATNSVRVGTGNVSAGTSIFAMVVLAHPLRSVHPEIDIVTTPAGDLVGMVHCNNGTSELDGGSRCSANSPRASARRWVRTSCSNGCTGSDSPVSPDAGGLLAYNFVAGEPIVNLDEGRPLVVRQSGSRFTLANFVRAQLYATVGTLRIGMDVLRDEGIQPTTVRARRLRQDEGRRSGRPGGRTRHSDLRRCHRGRGRSMGDGAARCVLPRAAPARPPEDFLTNDVFDDVTLRPSPPGERRRRLQCLHDRYRRGLAIVRRAVEDACPPRSDAINLTSR